MLTALLLAAALPLTIEDYATINNISSPKFSPDGTRIAYVVNRADMERSVYDADLWLADANGAKVIELTRAKGNDNHPRWSPDGRRIAFLSERDGRAAIWVMDADGGEAQKLSDEKAAISDFEWSPDGKSIAFVMRDPAKEDREDVRVVGQGTRYARIYMLNVESKKSWRVTQGDFDLTEISWLPDGQTLLAVQGAPGVGDFQKSDIVLVSTSGRIRPLVARIGADFTPSVSPDGRNVVFLSTGGRNDWLAEQELFVVPTAGGEPKRVATDYGRTPSHVVWSDDSKTIWFDGPHNTHSQLYRVNPDGSGFRNVSQFEGLIADVDIRNGRAAFIRQSLTEPPELFVDGKQITHHNDAYRGRQLGETKVIKWKNPKDGLEIEGLLTLPIGYEPGKRYPLLTFAHGGPASRFDQGFIGYLGFIYPAHVFAHRGFAVLRPNPRGTGGYRESFREANRRDWGGMDWIDINAGIDKLIADGIADPGRLGLMGWSYGGFIAAWAQGNSERFKAISIGAPVVDLLSFHGTTDIRAFIPSYFRGDEIADAAQTDDATLMAIRRTPMSLDLLRARSPLWHVKPSKARVLIQHGDADDRVPLSQGTMLYRRLQELGVDVTMAIYPRSPHTPREPKQRIDVMRRNVELFDGL